MTEVKYLKSMRTSFGKEVIKLTPQIPEKHILLVPASISFLY